MEEELKKLQDGFNTEFTNLKGLPETQSKEIKSIEKTKLNIICN